MWETGRMGNMLLSKLSVLRQDFPPGPLCQASAIRQENETEDISVREEETKLTLFTDNMTVSTIARNTQNSQN